jgi:hypothetical protein
MRDVKKPCTCDANPDSVDSCERHGKPMRNETEIRLKIAEAKDKLNEMRKKTQLLDARFAVELAIVKTSLITLQWVLKEEHGRNSPTRVC